MSKSKQPRKEPYKVFIGNLPEDCDHTALRSHFTSYGEIDKLYVCKNSHTENLRGYGYLLCKDQPTYTTILEVSHSIEGTEIFVEKEIINICGVKHAESRKKVRCEDILPRCSTEDVLAVFERFGKVKSFNRYSYRGSRGAQIALKPKSFLQIEYFNIESANICRKKGKVRICNEKVVMMKGVEPDDDKYSDWRLMNANLNLPFYSGLREQ